MTTERNEQMYQWWVQGVSITEIARRVQLSRTRADQIIKWSARRAKLVDIPPNHIANLNISARAYNALTGGGISTIDELSEFLASGKYPKGSGKLIGFGKVAMKECREALTARGMLKRTEIKRIEYTQLSDDDWGKCVTYWKFCCAVCGDFAALEQDHWIPRGAKVFPGSQMTNILPLCRGCNEDKTDKDPYLWLIAKLGRKAANEKMRAILDYFDWCETQ